jgi:Right handed beta helix region
VQQQTHEANTTGTNLNIHEVDREDEPMQKGETRARLPNTWIPTSGYRVIAVDQGNQRIRVLTSDLAGLQSSMATGQVEIKINPTFWQDINFINSTSTASGTETWLNLRNGATDWDRMVDHHYTLTNSMDFLDTPGEWHINKTTNELHYRPRAGENMATAEVYLPRIVELFHLQGTITTPVRNIQFKGLRFEHTTFVDVETTGCTKCFSSGYNSSGGGGEFPGAIGLVYATNVGFEGNVFRHLGGGALTGFGWQNSTIIGNVFHDIAAQGFNLKATATGNTDVRNQNRGFTISNNYITTVGQDYNANHAIDAYSLDASTFIHNEIETVPQGGISLSRWDDNVPVGNTTVRFNKIHDVCKIMQDYGPVYMWGNWPNSNVFENWIFGSRSPWGDAPGIYCDEGYDPASPYCENWTIENNVVEQNDVDIYLHRAENNTIINFNGTLWDTSQDLSNTFTQNGPLNITAVKANAGLQSAYATIKALVTEDSTGGTGTLPPPPKPPGDFRELTVQTWPTDCGSSALLILVANSLRVWPGRVLAIHTEIS